MIPCLNGVFLMIITVLEWLKVQFGLKFPIVFTYYSTRMLLAAATSLIICIFLGPKFIRKLYEMKIGQSIRKEECPQLYQLHEKKKDTPTMGGALMLASMLASLFLWMDVTHIFTLILFLATVVFGILGAQDDYLKLKYKNAKGLKGRYKLLIQVGFSCLIAAYLLVPGIAKLVEKNGWYKPPVVKEQMTFKTIQDASLMGKEVATTSSMRSLSIQEFGQRLYAPFLKDPLFKWTGALSILSACFMVFVITGCSNAVNLTDGLDGLAAGCLVLVAAVLAFFAFVSNHVEIASYLNILYIEGSGEIAIYLSAFAGACLGFLWYNGYPAQVFMGDTGSLALGGILGVSAVLLKRELLLAIIGGIFVMEALSVIIQVASFRYRNKKRVFLCAPLHHHFEYSGWPETKVVLRFWIIGLLLALLGLATLKFQ